MKYLCSERIFLWLEIGFILMIVGVSVLAVSKATKIAYWLFGVGVSLVLLVTVLTSTDAGRSVCKGEWEKGSTSI